MQIPKLIHQIWIGGKPMPETFEPLVKTWRDLNPKWSYRIWHDDFAPDLGTMSAPFQELLALPLTPIIRADILRLLVLYVHGGVYCDVDTECLRPLDELADGKRFFIGWEDELQLCNAVIGATPRHPAIASLLREVTASVFEKLPEALHRPYAVSGPAFATKVLTSAEMPVPDVDLLAPDVLYPTHYHEKSAISVLKTSGIPAREQFPSAFAIHYWAGSWLENGADSRSTEPCADRSNLRQLVRALVPGAARRALRRTINKMKWQRHVQQQRARYIPALSFRPGTDDDRFVIPEIIDQDMFRLDALAKYLPKDGVLIDGGAHIGVFSLAWARTFPAFSITAYEPAPQNFDLLQQNIANFSQIKASSEAIGVNVSEMTLYGFGETGRWSLCSEQNRTNDTPSEPGPMIETIPLEAIIAQIPDAQTIVLKLDLEGFEAKVLDELPEPALQRITMFLLEEHHVPVNHQRFLDAGFVLLFHPLGHERQFVYLNAASKSCGRYLEQFRSSFEPSAVQ